MNVVNVGYASTNYYLLEIQGGKLLVDCGWPGTLPKLRAQLKRKSVAFDELKYLLVTHFHPDHAGLTQELKDLGLKLILLEGQAAGVASLTRFFVDKSEYPYRQIRLDDSNTLSLTFADSRDFLAKVSLAGEIIPTPGHSDDSLTLVLDEGLAFTGDLFPRLALPEDDLASRQSWDRIYRHKITRIYPAHGG